MWLDEYVPTLAVADTTRPILLILFIVGLFGLAGLGVVLGRKHISAQNARALSADAGLEKGSVRGGDATFSSDWLTEAREEVDEVPRQSWSDVLTMQGLSETPDTGPSPFGNNADPTPVPEQAVYEQPVYEQATPVPEQPVYEQPVYEQPVYEQPTPVPEAAPEAPSHSAVQAPAAGSAQPGGEYAAYFGATPPPPPPSEPFNIWASDSE